MTKKSYHREEEKLSLSKRERVALLQILVPRLRLRPEPDSESAIAGHLFTSITGYSDLAALLERKQAKHMKEAIRIDPLEKAFLLKAVHDGIEARTAGDGCRKDLESLLEELKKKAHPLSGNRNAES
jgi:hypothetical protein